MRRLLIVSLLLASPPLAAQPAPPPTLNVTRPSSEPIDTLIYLVTRAQEIGWVLAGKADPDATFAPLFMAQVPAGKLKEISQSLTDQYGPVVEVTDIVQTGT